MTLKFQLWRILLCVFLLAPYQNAFAQGSGASVDDETKSVAKDSSLALIDFKMGEDAADALLARSPFDVERRIFVQETDFVEAETALPPTPTVQPRLLGFSETAGQRLAILENPLNGDVSVMALRESGELGTLVAMDTKTVVLERDMDRQRIHLYGDHTDTFCRHVAGGLNQHC